MDGRGRSGGASAGLRAAVAARTRRHSLRSASLWVCCWVAWGLHIFLAGFFMGGQRGKEGGRLHAGLVVARETERNGWVGMEFVRLFIPYVTGLRAAAVVSVSRHSRCVRRACVPSLCVCVCFFCENISLSIYRMEADAILCRCLVFPFPCRVSFSIMTKEEAWWSLTRTLIPCCFRGRRERLLRLYLTRMVLSRRAHSKFCSNVR
jgi:hypothetical protein